jgi:hypothetical protein
MELEKSALKPISYLAGFHLHRPDYNIKSIKGELYNFIMEQTNKVFDIIQIDDNLEICKIKGDKNFEIKYESSSLIYQDGEIEYKTFKDNALGLLKKWQSLCSSANHLKISGILRRVLISIDAPKGVYNSRIYDNYLTNLNISEKKKSLSLHINYSYQKGGLDYNINLNLDEVLKKDYEYEFRLDVNKFDFDKLMNIDYSTSLEIFNFSEKYYEKEFFEDIGIQLK